MLRNFTGVFTTLSANAVKGVLAIVLAVALTACLDEPEDPDEKAYRRLEKALAALERPLRADVTVDVFVRGMSIPPIRMNAEMRGTQRTSPAQKATDLDLRSVTTTIERQYGEDIVRNSSVRVIVLGDRTYIRNTLESDEWRSSDVTASLVKGRGLDPSGTGTMLNTTMVVAMYRSKGRLAVFDPSPTPTAGMRANLYNITCNLYECLKEAPDIYEIARKVHPVDQPIQLSLAVDEHDLPRILEVKSEFPVSDKDNTQGVLVTFRAKLTLHDHGKPQQITAPVN